MLIIRVTRLYGEEVCRVYPMMFGWPAGCLWIAIDFGFIDGG